MSDLTKAAIGLAPAVISEVVKLVLALQKTPATKRLAVARRAAKAVASEAGVDRILRERYGKKG